MTTLVIVGETWEAPFASATLRALAPKLPASAEILVPPELARITGSRPVITIGRPPGRFRSYDEIVAELRELLGDRAYHLVAAGVDGEHDRPRHRPPARRDHRHRSIGGLDIWTVDTGDDYFAALTSEMDATPVWPAYGPGRPVFTVNTNDFGESAPRRHDDYVVLASGLLGLRTVVESDPGPGARVFFYDINPDQLAWSRFVLAHAGQVATLAELARRFAAAHPAVTVREVQPHEQANAHVQADWYAGYRQELAALPRRAALRWLTVDLLTRPAGVLSVLGPDREVFFMYLDLFVVWHVHDDPPWIVEFPGLARSLEAEVRGRARAATFLPGPHSRVLQVEGSPQVTGGRSCT